MRRSRFTAGNTREVAARAAATLAPGASLLCEPPWLPTPRRLALLVALRAGSRYLAGRRSAWPRCASQIRASPAPWLAGSCNYILLLLEAGRTGHLAHHGLHVAHLAHDAAEVLSAAWPSKGEPRLRPILRALPLWLPWCVLLAGAATQCACAEAPCSSTGCPYARRAVESTNGLPHVNSVASRTAPASRRLRSGCLSKRTSTSVWACIWAAGFPRGPARPRALVPLAALSLSAAGAPHAPERCPKRPAPRLSTRSARTASNLSPPPPRYEQQPREGCRGPPDAVDAERNENQEHGGSHSVRRRPRASNAGTQDLLKRARHDDAADGRDGDGQEHGRQKEEEDQKREPSRRAQAMVERTALMHDGARPRAVGAFQGSGQKGKESGLVERPSPAAN